MILWSDVAVLRPVLLLKFTDLVRIQNQLLVTAS